MLVHRLDAAGDTEGADIARTVSDRLRAICGDLRLPILDDLGVGPALDWLVLRIERLAGGEVRLERSDGTRPPADVELAFFRVAQEALSNAVKHGRPPIVVRYATTRRRRVAVDRRCGTRDRARRERVGRAVGPLRDAQHGAAGRGDRRDPRRPALAGRRHPRRARLASPLIRVAIVDDHPVVGQGTAAILDGEPDVGVVGVATSLEAARADGLLDRQAVDVLLLDLRLGSDSGLRLLADASPGEARGGGAETLPAIIVLTAYDYPQYVDAALQLGAAGFVLKTAPLSELVDAIRTSPEADWRSRSGRGPPRCA